MEKKINQGKQYEKLQKFNTENVSLFTQTNFVILNFS